MWTQRYAIINWKVVVIQQRGNYFDYYRHLLHWLHIHIESKQQQNNKSHSSELGSTPGFTGEVEGLGQREVAEHKDYCVCAINCASAPS